MSAEDKTTQLLNKFEFLANVIPKEKWGFQSDLLENLREAKQKIVEETVPKSVLKGLTTKQKIKLGQRLGPKTDTVLDIFNWAAKSDFADAGMPKIMAPVGKQPVKRAKKTAEQTEEEAKIAAILLAKGIKPRNGAIPVSGPPAAKKAKVAETATPVAEESEDEVVDDDFEDEVVDDDSEDEEDVVDDSEMEVDDDEESGSEVVEDDEAMEVDENASKAVEPVPPKKQPVAKKTMQPTPKIASVPVPAVEESSDEEEEDDEEQTDAAITELKQVAAESESESDAQVDSEDDDDVADSNESVDGSFVEDDEEEETVVTPSKAKQSAPSKPLKDTKPVKVEVKPKKETIDTPTTEDFDFSLLKNSLEKPDKVDKKKKSKADKRDSFKGRDYKSLLKKVQGREERLDKVREKNPEAATAMETSIKFKKALKQASGEKVKDNPELLKKGIKRKEKQKEVRSKKWKKRVNTVKKAQADRQAKRTANIQKRKDTKKEHKIKRAKKRVKA